MDDEDSSVGQTPHPTRVNAIGVGRYFGARAFFAGLLLAATCSDRVMRLRSSESDESGRVSEVGK